MNCRWVNHKQTFRQEFHGHYIWCPKLKMDGARYHFDETVSQVCPGDVVLSHASAAVQGFGFAPSYCYSCPRPDEFGKVAGAWDVSGWRVDVGFQKFPQPLRTINHASSIASLLPTNYSPIRPDGKGNQGAYFSGIPQELTLLILQLADPAGSTAAGEW